MLVSLISRQVRVLGFNTWALFPSCTSERSRWSTAGTCSPLVPGSSRIVGHCSLVDTRPGDFFFSLLIVEVFKQPGVPLVAATGCPLFFIRALEHIGCVLEFIQKIGDNLVACVHKFGGNPDRNARIWQHFNSRFARLLRVLSMGHQYLTK